MTKRIIISGEKESGKSTILYNLSKYIKKKGYNVKGIIAKGLWKNNNRYGFDIYNIETEKIIPFARLNPSNPNVDKFIFDEKIIEVVSKSLSIKKIKDADFIIIDEVGKKEIAGKLWSNKLYEIAKLEKPIHIWSVRDKFISKVQNLWKFDDDTIFKISSIDETLEKIKKHFFIFF